MRRPFLGWFFLSTTLVALFGCANSVITEMPRSGKTGEAKASQTKDAVNIDTGLTDVSWKKYGAYTDELFEIVRVKWYKILEEARYSPKRGSSVVVTFKINSRGETDIVKVEDSGAGKNGTVACVSAITYSQPYRKWSQPMIADFGDEQELTCTFNYQ